MRVLLLLSAILAIYVAADKRFHGVSNRKTTQNNATEPVIISGVFEVPLDPFSPSDSRRLKLNYRSNVKYFLEAEPIFVYINDGSRDRWITQGLVHDLARDVHGALVTANNRYFGANIWGNLTTENLRYLTIDHILSDIPYLVRKVKEDLDSPDSRVIVWGTGLSGTIAALARKKYPHIIDGVWSSSGIFRAVTHETGSYNTVAWNIFYHGSEDCSKTVSQALHEVQQLVEEGNGERLQELFNLCDPVNVDDDQETTFFYRSLFNYISNHINRWHSTGIKEFCLDLTKGNSSLNSFSSWVTRVFSNNNECINLSYENAVSRLGESCNCGGRSAQYYFCTQLGTDFRVTSEESFGNVFPNVIKPEYFDNWCTDLFGSVYNRTFLEMAAENFNVQHGSQNQKISNAVFSNGDLDPFLDLGIAEYDVATSEALNTNYLGASADLDSINENDSPELTATKTRIFVLLTRHALNLDIADPDGDWDGWFEVNETANANRT